MNLSAFPSLSESSGFPTLKIQSQKQRRGSLSFHLFQRVVGFRRPTRVLRIKMFLQTCFHLFQRVVGFRQNKTRRVYYEVFWWFPSLSESSGFPTRKTIRELLEDSLRSFHLFQRVVGFRPYEVWGCARKGCVWFPSLSESSGFPTTRGRSQKWKRTSNSFHLFQRVVGFRHCNRKCWTTWNEYEVSISFRE